MTFHYEPSEPPEDLRAEAMARRMLAASHCYICGLSGGSHLVGCPNEPELEPELPGGERDSPESPCRSYGRKEHVS